MLESESVTNAKVAAVEDSLKKSKIDEALKIKVILLEVENEQMKKELEGMKGEIKETLCRLLIENRSQNRSICGK
jgi:hypothetical protein